MASVQAEAFHNMVRQYREAALGSGEVPTIEQMRAGSDTTMELIGVMPAGVSITEVTVAGMPALQFDPEDGDADAVVLYLHGGAYVMNSPQTHRKLVAGIAKACGCRAVAVDYRMAPEHPYPAAVEDGLAAYRALLDTGYDPRRVAIAGDSAGGGLTVATLVEAREASLPQPAAAVMLSPWTDLEGTGTTMDTNASVDLMIDRQAMQGVAAIYLNGADPRTPQASPLYAKLSELAPLYIQVGGHETLLDDSTRLAVGAAHAGVEVRLDVFPEMQHVFQSALGMLPESDEAIARIGAYLRDKLAPIAG